MLSVSRLRVLAEVARHGSLAGAAGALGHTVSAVSQQIGTLEREVGAALLDRHPRGVRLTEAGRTLAAHAATVLAGIHTAELAMAALGARVSARLRVASFTTANAELLPRAVRTFGRRHPVVELGLIEADCDDSTGSLARREVDLALVYEFPGTPLPARRDLRLTPLLDDQLHVLLPPDHRLADAVDLSLTDLADEAWIQGAHRSSTIAVLPAACRRAGFEPRIVFRADDQMTVRGLVGAGIGVALGSSLTVTSTPPGLAVVPLSESSLVRRVFAATLDGPADGTAVAAMIDCLRAAAGTVAAAAATSGGHGTTSVSA